MAKTIKSWNDFQRVIENRIQLALQQTQDVVAQCLHESLNEYYKEKVFNDGTSDMPSSYHRTYALLNSMVTTEVVRNGNMFHCEVKINESYLQSTYNKYGTTGLDVVTANETGGWHGTTEKWRVKGNRHIWTDTIENINAEGGVLAIFKEKLQKCGVHVVG